MTCVISGVFAAMATYGLDRSLEKHGWGYATCFIVGTYGFLATLIYAMFWSPG